MFVLIRTINPNNIITLSLNIISFILFIIAIITDGLDGYFARKMENVTDFGKHFDPLADSIFFIIIFGTFVYLELMPIYLFIIILAREAFMHIFLRPYLKKKGTMLPANIYGKLKTVFQCSFSFIIIFKLILTQSLYFFLNNQSFFEKYMYFTKTISYLFFIIITLLSIISLLIYLFQNRKKF